MTGQGDLERVGARGRRLSLAFYPLHEPFFPLRLLCLIGSDLGQGGLWSAKDRDDSTGADVLRSSD